MLSKVGRVSAKTTSSRFNLQVFFRTKNIPLATNKTYGVLAWLAPFGCLGLLGLRPPCCLLGDLLETFAGVQLLLRSSEARPSPGGFEK